MVKKIYGILGIILVLGSIAVFASNYNSNNTIESSEPIVLRVTGAAEGVTEASVRGIAKKEGFLQEELAKVNVKLETITTVAGGAGNPAAELLGSNSVDISSQGEIPIIHAIGAGIDVDIIAIEPFGGTRNAIVVLNGSEINSIKDLKGKKISSTYGGNVHLFWAYLLKKNGLSFKNDVTFVDLPTLERKTALISKQIDATGESLYLAAQWEREGWAKIIIDVNQVPEWTGQGVVEVRRAYGKKYPQVVIAYLKAQIRAQEWIKNHPNEYLDYSANASKAPTWAYKRQYPNDEFIQKYTLSQNVIDRMNTSKNALIEAGLHKDDFDIASRVDRTYLEAAYKELQSKK